MLWFSELGLADLEQVGGKNSSLGEMVSNLAVAGVRVPDGFATTADAYRRFIGDDRSGRADQREAGAGWTPTTSGSWPRSGTEIRAAVVGQPFPADLEADIRAAYDRLAGGDDRSCRSRSDPARPPRTCRTRRSPGSRRRSSTSAASTRSCTAIKEVFASLYNDRAIAYRVHHEFEHEAVALSAGVQRMVRSDIGASGVMFTMDTESGFADAVFITSSYGLGEAVVQGAVNPDEFYVYKPALRAGRPAILKRGVGGKATKMIYTDRRRRSAGRPSSSTSTRPTSAAAQPDRRRGRPSWPGTRWPSRSTTAGRWTSSGARTASTASSTSCRPGRRR